MVDLPHPASALALEAAVGRNHPGDEKQALSATLLPDPGFGACELDSGHTEITDVSDDTCSRLWGGGVTVSQTDL